MTHEVEEQYRRQTLVRARNGDVDAQAELEETYGVRVYSRAERERLSYELAPDPTTRRRKVRRAAETVDAG
jgi:hypothetical protein